MTTVTGTIQAVPVTLTHTEPPATRSIGSNPGNSDVDTAIGDYSNTGNAPQTITFNGLTALQNCSFVRQLWQLAGGFNVNNTTTTLQPGEVATLFVKVHTAPAVVGSTDTPYGYSVNTTWS